MNMQWDAETYGRDFSFVHRYGDGVAALIGATPGSTVLDLGCGNGALTHRLRQSGFQVMGLDASPDLLSAARKSYPDIEFVLGDAVDFSLPEPVDVVFSLDLSSQVQDFMEENFLWSFPSQRFARTTV